MWKSRQMPSWVVALYSVRGRNKTKTNNELENMTTLVLWANSYTKKAQPPGLLTCNSGDSCYQVSCLSPTRHRIGRPHKRRLEQSEPQRLNQATDRATQLHDCVVCSDQATEMQNNILWQNRRWHSCPMCSPCFERYYTLTNLPK